MPSCRTAPVAITQSPAKTFKLIPPQVPILIKVSAPQATNSSMAIAADGPPIPVEVTETFSPDIYPVYVVNSLFCAISLGSSKYPAIFSHLPGSPGKITYFPISPFDICK